MSEQDDFAAAVQSAIAAEPTESAPPEPQKEEQPKTAEIGDEATKPAPVTPQEAKPDQEAQKDWKAAAEAARAKQSARRSAKEAAAIQSTKLQALEAKLARYEAIEAKRETDPLGAAEEFGLNYDRLTKEYIRTLEKDPNQSPPEVKGLIQKFQQLETLVQQQQKQLEARQANELIRGFESEVKSLLEAKSEVFELTKTAEEGLGLVKAIVAAHWRETASFDAKGRLLADGETMATEKACQLAEDYFEKQQLRRFAHTKKFKSIASPPEKPKIEEKKIATAASTLSQSLLQSGSQSIPTFGSETEELFSMIKKLEAQQGN